MACLYVFVWFYKLILYAIMVGRFHMATNHSATRFDSQTAHHRPGKKKPALRAYKECLSSANSEVYKLNKR